MEILPRPASTFRQEAHGQIGLRRQFTHGHARACALCTNALTEQLQQWGRHQRSIIMPEAAERQSGALQSKRACRGGLQHQAALHRLAARRSLMQVI